MTDEYRELRVAARDALRELLIHTEPGTGLTLHIAYGDLDRALREQERGSLDSPSVQRVREELAAIRERDWVHRTSVHEREHAVLDALREGPATIAEITTRIAATHGEANVHSTSVASIVGRLYRAGNLSRTAEPRRTRSGKAIRGPQVQYRYSVREMSGAIVELDHAFEGER